MLVNNLIFNVFCHAMAHIHSGFFHLTYNSVFNPLKYIFVKVKLT